MDEGGDQGGRRQKKLDEAAWAVFSKKSKGAKKKHLEKKAMKIRKEKTKEKEKMKGKGIRKRDKG